MMSLLLEKVLLQLWGVIVHTQATRTILDFGEASITSFIFVSLSSVTLLLSSSFPCPYFTAALPLFLLPVVHHSLLLLFLRSSFLSIFSLRSLF
jgi:hypothetical protein